MRPERLVFLAAFVGAGLVLAGYYDEEARGRGFEVRHLWMALVPQACAALAAAGLWLARRPPRAAWGLALANAAFTASLTHLTLIFTVTLGPEEARGASWVPALGVAGFLAVPFATLFVTQRPMTRRPLFALVQAIAILAALLSVREIFDVARGFSALRLVGAILGVGAMVSLVRLTQRLAPRPRPTSG